jgi:hypothetical protein
MAVGDQEHRQSSFGLDYWLRRCEGFRVDGPDGRIGHVRGIRFGDAAEPKAFEVRAGIARPTNVLNSSRRRRRSCPRGAASSLGGEPAAAR